MFDTVIIKHKWKLTYNIIGGSRNFKGGGGGSEKIGVLGLPPLGDLGDDVPQGENLLI